MSKRKAFLNRKAAARERAKGVSRTDFGFRFFEQFNMSDEERAAEAEKTDCLSGNVSSEVIRMKATPIKRGGK